MQPAPIINNHPAVVDLILDDLATNGQNLPEGDAIAELYGAAAKLAIFLRAAKGQIADSAELNRVIVEDLIARKEFGISKYGVALQPFNGRDALQDAYEEVIDLVFYLRQAVYEQQNQEIVNAG